MHTDGDQWSRRSGAAVVSVAAFGAYAAVWGLGLAFAPNIPLTIFGFAPTREVWIRVLGIVIVAISVYYFRAARTRSRGLMEATVAARAVGAAGLVAISGLGLAEPAIALFGLVDAATAAWTALALRRAGAAQPGRDQGCG